jgi:hypothetical protein
MSSSACGLHRDTQVTQAGSVLINYVLNSLTGLNGYNIYCAVFWTEISYLSCSFHSYHTLFEFAVLTIVRIYITFVS